MINTDRAARMIAEDGGITVHAVTGALPITGYAVAQPGRERIYRQPAGQLELTAILRSYAYAHADVLRDPATYLGAWTHDGRLHLDTVEIISDRVDAELAGIAADQLAIWDVAAGQEIPLAGVELEGPAA